MLRWKWAHKREVEEISHKPTYTHRVPDMQIDDIYDVSEYSDRKTGDKNGLVMRAEGLVLQPRKMDQSRFPNTTIHSRPR